MCLTNLETKQPPSEDWIEKELQHVKLGDKRLNKRFLKTSKLIEAKASGSINQSCRSWKEVKGAYRLLNHEKLKESDIYSSHQQETCNRIKGHSLSLCVQDTSYLDYDTHTKTQGLGSISKAYTKHKQGLLLHSTLALSEEGLPLGLTSQQCWSRPEREEEAKQKSRRKYVSDIKDKESYKWIKALKDTRNLVPEETRIVTIGDREADIFELLWTAETLKTLFLVRNRQNRKFIQPDGCKTNIRNHLQSILNKKEVLISIPQKKNHRARTASVEIKFSSGLIPIRSASIYGSKKSQHKISDKLAVYIVSAQEINPPADTEAINWILITNIAIYNFEDALERIRWYQLRWRIEEYFRILKSGCNIERSRLSTKEKLQKLIALKSVIAYKILLLSKLALTAPETDCTQVLSQEEWQTLYIREHQTTQVPQKPPNIKQALIWLGKLGGFLNRKNDRLPGAMTLWRGYEELQQSIMMLRIFSGNNTYG